jgi:hypothetical protein
MLDSLVAGLLIFSLNLGAHPHASIQHEQTECESKGSAEGPQSEVSPQKVGDDIGLRPKAEPNEECARKHGARGPDLQQLPVLL